VCVARLVEKKGLDRQLRIYAAAKAAGMDFHVRIIGDGPLRGSLETLAGTLGVGALVTFAGHLPQHEVWEQLSWADVLLHTGVVAPSGDRDGLPNVIPEAMAAGVVVITSPAAATTEAITHERTGIVADVDDASAWVTALSRLAIDDAWAETLRAQARRWVEENFDAHVNAERLLRRFERAILA
jgi:glycosyltransferase involved in cell wall biosynthesis